MMRGSGRKRCVQAAARCPARVGVKGGSGCEHKRRDRCAGVDSAPTACALNGSFRCALVAPPRPSAQAAVDKRGGAPETRAVEKMRIDEEGRAKRAEARLSTKVRRSTVEPGGWWSALLQWRSGPRPATGRREELCRRAHRAHSTPPLHTCRPPRTQEKHKDTDEKFDKELTDLMEKLNVDKHGNPRDAKPNAGEL